MVARAPLVEIFHSIQGEARFVGAAMTFVRVATCPIRCVYCDTPNSYTAAAEFEVRAADGTVARSPNPVSAARCAELVDAVAPPHVGATRDAVSLTGGEPLVFPEFVAEFGQAVRALGAPLHLESAALDPDALARCVASIDHLSADYKLPETLKDGADHGARHLACVDCALEVGKTVDVKLVLTAAVRPESVATALRRLAPVRDQVLLVLQPVTPFGELTERLGADALLREARSARDAGFEVRVIPQLHPVLGID